MDGSIKCFILREDVISVAGIEVELEAIVANAAVRGREAKDKSFRLGVDGIEEAVIADVLAAGIAQGWLSYDYPVSSEGSMSSASASLRRVLGCGSL